MKKIYACLVGNWVCLNDDPECVISENGQNPYLWWEEGAPIYSPLSPEKRLENSLHGLNYINLYYLGKNYRINPIFIQIVTE